MTFAIRGASLLAVVLSLALNGCGGGGGSAGSPSLGGTPDNPGTPGSASPDPAGPSSSFAQQCAPENTLASANQRSGSRDTEKKWLRAYFDEAYLWRDEVPRVDPGDARFGGSDFYAAMDAYFGALKTPQLTDSGARRDKFSFIYPTAEWKALLEGGSEVSYGIEWHIANATPPRRVRIAYVEASSPAAAAGLARGDELVSVDGTAADVTTDAGVDALYAGLYPASGSSHAFVFQRNGEQLSRSLTGTNVTRNPVPQARVLTLPGGARAGYLLFNDHNVPSENLLINAVSDFRTQGISELVLDLRYNSGGYLYIASELATMIAGTARTAGQPFETLKYSARRSGENEVTPFSANSCGLVSNRCANVQPLPLLNLSRVYVLVQSGTCSASEAVINGLRGVNMDVVLIGGQTCGKPYGFVGRDNCGISYFPMEFAGVNAKGFGDYSDGFVPGSGSTARYVPGCTVADDFAHPLGDTQEAMLAAALNHVATGQCPISTGTTASARAQASPAGESAAALHLRRHPARSNRLVVPSVRN
ncbi:MAG: PDZ domain-containing protein [Rubrivivax sp.]|nr:MAG: PDZ domain-containing protein [Rubrivivax sp.]